MPNLAHATGATLKGRNVPPALILESAAAMENSNLDHDQKIVMSILQWFNVNGRPGVPQHELEIAVNIVDNFLLGIRTRALQASVLGELEEDEMEEDEVEEDPAAPTA